ncbi:MAG: heme o synthase [Planctomycetota bacterium]
MHDPALALAAAPAAGSRMNTLRAYYELGKPRLSALAVFAVVAGCFCGWTPYGVPPLDVVAATTVGTFLVAAASSSFNMYRERELDARMHRTQARPLPSGRLQPRQVLAFGWITAALGLGMLLVFSTWMAALVCAAILGSYVLVYTPMKTRTPLNTLVGAIPGALPPVVGYAAVTGRLGFGALILFMILFCWQIPHFLAIAWRHREDYARAGMRMLPVVDPAGERTRMTMLLYTAGLGIASLLPFVVRMAGEVYLGTAICLDVLFFVPAVMAAITRWESAMRMTFLVSIVYLPALLLVLVLDRQDPVFPL